MLVTYLIMPAFIKEQLPHTLHTKHTHLTTCVLLTVPANFRLVLQPFCCLAHSMDMHMHVHVDMASTT